jgi:thymidylate synthase
MEPYDNLLEDILKNGFLKKNRTRVNTLNLFGTQHRYRIDTYFPLLTGRKVWPKAIFAELLWVLSGSTNVRDLQKLGSHIWDDWEDREFEEEHLYENGDLGPIYGFQLRHFNGVYPIYNKESTGFDQLRYVINTLKSDPDSRRNLFSLWNPLTLDIVRLPACHVMFQIFTDENKLYGMLTQRSADVPIGVPANIQFYSTLLYLLAAEANLVPYELIHSIGVAHVYLNQIDAVTEYLSRHKPDSPKLVISPAQPAFEVSRESMSLLNTDGINSTGYLVNDFKVVDYNPRPPIKIPVMV